jgi:SAM-dependent methyltransferase
MPTIPPRSARHPEQETPESARRPAQEAPESARHAEQETPGSARHPEPETHRHRQIAESFGLDPERYDRARPGYPDAMVQAIVAACPGPEVLDVGCGTGIVARQFQAAGCRVLGVDVDERMADFARRRGLEVEVARFEDWNAGGREFDAAIAGQTWHWVDPVVGAAKAVEVLRPGGRLALFWNMFQPSPEVAEIFSAVYREVMPDLPFRPWAAPTPDPGSEFFTRPAQGIRAAGAFGTPERWRFDWERRYNRDEWLDQLPTAGGHGRLPPAQLDALLAGIGAAIDALGGNFTMRYDTVVITAVRTDPA